MFDAMKASTIVIVLLLIAVGILAYGWGRDSAQSAVYKEQAKAAQEALDGLQLRYDSAGMRIEGLTKAMELRTPEKEKLIAREKDEPQRLKDEHAILDTAGALAWGRAIIWSNNH